MCAVIPKIGILAYDISAAFLISSLALYPFITGISISMTTMSYQSFLSALMASAPLTTHLTVAFLYCDANNSINNSPFNGSSSASKIFKLSFKGIKSETISFSFLDTSF